LEPTALKIDVEGAELGVLAGALTVLRRHRPDMFIEVASGRENRQAVWELLQQLSYTLYLLAPGGHGPVRRIAALEQFIDAGSGIPSNDVLATCDPDLRQRLESDFDLGLP
jgi:hypothetical protein